MTNSDREAAYGLTYAGLSKSLGDDTEKERRSTLAARAEATPREGSGSPEGRGRREAAPPQEPQEGQNRKGAPRANDNREARGERSSGDERTPARSSHRAVMPRSPGSAESGASEHGAAPRRGERRQEGNAQRPAPHTRRPPGANAEGGAPDDSGDRPPRRRGPRRRR